MDREFLENYAEENSMDLSYMADKVIAAINRKDGNCPCRIERTPCPCSMMKKEVESKGKCTCNLFTKRKD